MKGAKGAKRPWYHPHPQLFCRGESHNQIKIYYKGRESDMQITGETLQAKDINYTLLFPWLAFSRMRWGGWMVLAVPRIKQRRWVEKRSKVDDIPAALLFGHSTNTETEKSDMTLYTLLTFCCAYSLPIFQDLEICISTFLFMLLSLKVKESSKIQKFGLKYRKRLGTEHARFLLERMTHLNVDSFTIV